MNTQDHEIIDRHGKRVHRDGVLQDGDRMVTRMTMMDGADPALAALASAAALADSVKRIEQFDARGHRPGFVSRDAATSTTIEKALDDRDKRLSDAWKTPTTTDATTIETAAVLRADAPKETLFAARDQAVADRDKRTSEAWRNRA